MRAIGKQIMAFGWSVGKPVESIATRLAGMAVCISTTITRSCLKNILELDSLS